MRIDRTLARLAGVVLLAFSLPAGALAQQIVVIANSELRLSADDVADVFLGEKQFASGVKIVPVDNGPLQEAFVGKVLNMDSVKYNGKWAKKAFREGLNPPPVKSGDAEVGEYVKRNPGAIGYVSSVPAGVTVIRRF